MSKLGKIYEVRYGDDYYQVLYSKLCSARRVNSKETNYGKEGLYC